MDESDMLYVVMFDNGFEYDDNVAWIFGIFTAKHVALEKATGYLRQGIEDQSMHNVNLDFYMLYVKCNQAHEINPEYPREKYTYDYSKKAWYIPQYI